MTYTVQYTHKITINAYLFLFISQTGNMPNVLTGFRKSSGSIKPKCPEMVRNDPKLKIRFFFLNNYSENTRDRCEFNSKSY